MTSKTRRFELLLKSRFGLAGLALFFAGCNGGTQSASEALEKTYQDNPQLSRPNLAKFAGRVTVDGQPPAAGTTILVFLNDEKKPWPDPKKSRLLAVCQPNGEFQFSTSLGGDGTTSGSYVVTFAQLHARGKRGFLPPDELKNLYNDPEKNSKNPDFKVELTPPGRIDYQFNLEVAGKDPVTRPGPFAVTKMLW